jgi:hypothetical protein
MQLQSNDVWRESTMGADFADSIDAILFQNFA